MSGKCKLAKETKFCKTCNEFVGYESSYGSIESMAYPIGYKQTLFIRQHNHVCEGDTLRHVNSVTKMFPNRLVFN